MGNLICLDDVERYDYVSDLCKDPSNWPFDYGIVAVLDGETLRLTPYRIRNIPPPMAANMLPIASTPAHVAFDTTGKIFAILRQREVDIATWSDFNTIRVANPKILDTYRYRRTLKVPVLRGSLHNFFAVEDMVRQVVLIEHDLVAILADDMHSSSIVKVLSRRDDTSQLEEVYSTSGLGMIVRLMYTTTGLILFETGDGTIYNLGDPRSTQTSLSPSPITRLPTRCPWIGFATIDNHVTSFPSLIWY